jgi:hypothetical protein
LITRLKGCSVIVLATFGVWFFWSQYSYLSGLSWWHENVQRLRASGATMRPDYDHTTLSWQMVQPKVFEIEPGQMRIVTNSDPFGYQAFANVKRDGASAADIQFDVDVESGGASIGLLQAGKWIAISSTRSTGAFADWNSAQLDYHRTLTVAIANNNPAGESRLTVRSVRLFLRK